MISLVYSVYITVGGESSYEVLQNDYQRCAGLRAEANKQFPPYDIDWCKFTLVRFIGKKIKCKKLVESPMVRSHQLFQFAQKLFNLQCMLK